MSVEAGGPFGEGAAQPNDALRSAAQIARARRPDGEALARMRARAIGLGPLGGAGPGGASGGVNNGASGGAAAVGAGRWLAAGTLLVVALGGVGWWMSASTGDVVTGAIGSPRREDVAPDIALADDSAPDIAPTDDGAARLVAASSDVAAPSVAPTDLTMPVSAPTRTAATPSAPSPRAVIDHDLVADTADAELALIRAAQSSIDARPELALRFSERHRARFPSGLLAEERETLAIDALVRLGRAQAAQTRAQAMRQRWPASAHWTRLERRFAEAGLTLPP